MYRTLRTLALGVLLPAVSLAAASAAESPPLHVRVSWGHVSPGGTPFFVRLAGEGLSIAAAGPVDLEAVDHLDELTCASRAGGGDVDAVELTLDCEDAPQQTVEPSNSIWRDLIALSDADTARRLRHDPAIRRDPRKLTIHLNAEATRGFSLTIDQLLREKTIWVRDLDVYVAMGDPPRSFADHQQELEAGRGQRILERVAAEPEATRAEYVARWEDMGSPAYKHASQPAPGHIIGLAWDSSIAKFGIDRGAGVWNDYGNPDRFRLTLRAGDLDQEITPYWKSQSLVDALPVVTTRLERDGLRYDIEQFAYPLGGPSADRRGDMGMLLLEKVTVTNLAAEARSSALELTLRRAGQPGAMNVDTISLDTSLLAVETQDHGIALAVQGPGASAATRQARTEQPAESKGPTWAVAELRIPLDLDAGEAREFVIKLPSPIAAAADRKSILGVDYAAARITTVKFWSDYEARGARFHVPEKVVNDLVRANLWHALRLPRRHGGQEPDVRIDLPYSNFAYDQHGTPWPVNQAVYVDYMLYMLRGYHEIALEELLAIYRNNQEPNGRVGGFANWGVYTPSMIYTSGQYYLLSGDRSGFERLLPPTLKALDWCLAEMRKAAAEVGAGQGLVRAPLNDGTGAGLWAFNQAYFYAGLETLGRALARIGHPRARECADDAVAFRADVERAFASASVASPLVGLRDGTWCPFVPCEVLTPRRLMDQWYPTDVDTGPLHLVRLGALAARSELADWLLHDHEDNLFLHAWGMANEPVYNQQATAYLLRDDPKAVIRAFYSYMACAFSHTALEPVEHRWTWGQYFGPPSTDGAWFELFRNMLIREADDGALFLFQATPRAWLADGQRIEIESAPTLYGPVSAALTSRAATGVLAAEIALSGRGLPTLLRVRFRHPAGLPIQSVTVNGEPWHDFNPAQETITIAGPSQRRYSIAAHY